MSTHRKSGPSKLFGTDQTHHLGGESGKRSKRTEETGNEKKSCFQRQLHIDMEYRHCGADQVTAKQIGHQGAQG